MSKPSPIENCISYKSSSLTITALTDVRLILVDNEETVNKTSIEKKIYKKLKKGLVVGAGLGDELVCGAFRVQQSPLVLQDREG